MLFVGNSINYTHVTRAFFFDSQASSLASDVKGKTPIFAKVLKTASAVGGAAANLLIPGHRRTASSLGVKDQEAVVQEIALHHRTRRSNVEKVAADDDEEDDDDGKENSVADDTVEQQARFAYIITRPTAFLTDGPSTKKVSASKSVRCDGVGVFY